MFALFLEEQGGGLGGVFADGEVPELYGALAVGVHPCYVGGVLNEDGADVGVVEDGLAGAVGADDLVDVLLGFGVFALHEEDPGVGVDVGFVAGLEVYGAVAHLFGAGEVLAVEREVVGVVVETEDVVFVVSEGVVVGLVGLALLVFAVVEVAHDVVHVGDEGGTVVVVLECDEGALEYLEGFVGIVALYEGEGEEVGVGELFGVVVDAASADFFEGGVVFEGDVVLHEPACGDFVVGVDAEEALHDVAELGLGHLAVFEECGIEGVGVDIGGIEGEDLLEAVSDGLECGGVDA